MIRAIVVLACLLSTISLLAIDEKPPSYPSLDYDSAHTHEIKPHRDTIPLEGIRSGLNQLRLTLTVSPTGDVLAAEASGDGAIMKFWPQLEKEVRQWRFVPFQEDGKAVMAQVEEYLNLVPPERLPKLHAAPPTLGPDSKVAITLRRSGCLGSCSAYTVTASTEGIVFDGGFSVVAAGKHIDQVDPNKVRELARKFVDHDFYSMDDRYVAVVTDCPMYILSISIAGHEKEVMDYVGAWEGMPAVVTELEEDVDTFARSERWIEGRKGLVDALKAEKFDFATFEAQVMLKEVASRGDAATMSEFLKAGVPLAPLRSPSRRRPTWRSRSRM
jgi:hypothetical protein